VAPILGQQFQPNLAEGSLRRTTGEHVVALSLDFVRSLHETISEQFGPEARDILYRCGYEWGLQDSMRFAPRVAAQMEGSNLDLWQMDGKFVFESWWAPLAEAGWGRCTFDVSALARSRVVVELRGSIVAERVTGSEGPICHLYAGLFAGALSFYERAERHAIEILCRAQGSQQCQFLVAPGAEIDSAETWRKQGATAADIVRRLS
jgi:predicted hydrocarbon binding protein